MARLARFRGRHVRRRFAYGRPAVMARGAPRRDPRVVERGPRERGRGLMACIARLGRRDMRRGLACCLGTIVAGGAGSRQHA